MAIIVCHSKPKINFEISLYKRKLPRNNEGFLGFYTLKWHQGQLVINDEIKPKHQ